MGWISIVLLDVGGGRCHEAHAEVDGHPVFPVLSSLRSFRPLPKTDLAKTKVATG